jgi:hypothetical protein
MPIDVSRWSPGVIAAVATCAAATVAAVTAFVVAVINSWSARRLAREAARRTYRLTVIGPYFEFLDRRIAMLTEILEVGPILSASLRKVAELLRTSKKVEADQEVDAIALRLDELVSGCMKDRAIHSPALYAFLISDRYILDSFHPFIEANTEFFSLFVSAGGFKNTPEQLEKLREAGDEALKAAVILRLAIEGSIFGTRGWLRRGVYFIGSTTRSAWKKRFQSKPEVI